MLARLHPTGGLFGGRREHVAHVSAFPVDEGHTALRIADADGPWDAFVLDIGLPDMTGYELVRRLRAMPGGDRPVCVAVTGYGQAQDRERSLEAGFDYHLVKPVDVSTLVQVVGGG